MVIVMLVLMIKLMIVMLASINDNVVNASIDENPVGVHADTASENVIPRRLTRVCKPVLRYGVVPYE